MYSGGDSSDDINNLNQLGGYGFVNQVAVSKAVAAGQNIDWAQLAQQWIQMRDNTELGGKLDANASAYKTPDPSCTNFKFEEKGEADMDMDDEEQTDEKTQRISNNLASTSSCSNLNTPWFLAEGNSQIAPRSAINQWNPWPNQEMLPQNLPTQNAINNGPTNPTAHIPSLLKISVPHPSEIRVLPDITNQPDNTSMMDAAKRKGLPAWIREGLEKMEREKQKQLEKELKDKDINLYSDETSNKINLIKSISSLNGVSPATILDEESSDNEETIAICGDSEIDGSFKKEIVEDDDAYSSVEVKTYEQKLADLMISVRRTLTELLLEVTNEEIAKVADETVKIFKSKASSAQVVRKSALSALTGKLGLAAYGDSSSENDSDSDENNSPKRTPGQSESDNDSEEEIRNVIRLKRRGFIKTSEEIEERVALAAAREEEKLKYFLLKEEEEDREHSRKKQERDLSSSSAGHSGYNIFKGYEKDFGEITETNIQNLNGKRQRERSNRRERITRFSDNKDKYVAVPNATAFLTNINSSATNFGSSNNSTALPTSSQRLNVTDINGLLPNYTSTGVANVLNAADAALEKALKGKASVSPEKQSRRHERDRSYKQSKKRQRPSESKNSRSRSKSSSSSSSSSSSTSSDSDSSSTSTSRSSHSSKYKHRSAKKQKSRTSADRKYERLDKSHRGDRKYSSFSYEKRERESTSNRNKRSASSDSEDEYRRGHRSSSHRTRKSSHTRSYSSSRHARDREHSRSHSRSSYSSNNRRQ